MAIKIYYFESKLLLNIPLKVQFFKKLTVSFFNVFSFNTFFFSKNKYSFGNLKLFNALLKIKKKLILTIKMIKLTLFQHFLPVQLIQLDQHFWFYQQLKVHWDLKPMLICKFYAHRRNKQFVLKIDWNQES